GSRRPLALPLCPFRTADARPRNRNGLRSDARPLPRALVVHTHRAGADRTDSFPPPRWSARAVTPCSGRGDRRFRGPDVRILTSGEISSLHQAYVDALKREGHFRSPRIEEAFRAVPRHLFVPGYP